MSQNVRFNACCIPKRNKKNQVHMNFFPKSSLKEYTCVFSLRDCILRIMNPTTGDQIRVRNGGRRKFLATTDFPSEKLDKDGKSRNLKIFLRQKISVRSNLTNVEHFQPKIIVTDYQSVIFFLLVNSDIRVAVNSSNFHTVVEKQQQT